MDGDLGRRTPVGGLGRARTTAGTILAGLGLAGLTAGLVPARDSLALASVVLLYLVVVVAVAAVGGLWPALATAVASDLAVNFFFVPPYHTLAVESPDHVITLVVYVAVAITVSVAVDLAARQRAEAARTGIESELLARITAEPLGEDSLTILLTHVRDTLHMDSAAMLETDATDTERVVAAVGPPLAGSPALSVPAGDRLRLVVHGPEVFAPDPRFLTRLATAAARTLQAQRLAAQAAHARELAEVDRLRAALLAAVGHDLRTPLAGLKAASSSLRDPEIDLTQPQRAELLATVEESADRMESLVENLLAMSRLQAGALSVQTRPVALDEIVAAALLHLPGPNAAQVDVPDDLPLVHADPGLLERVIANLVANAHTASPPDRTVRIRGHATGDHLELQVIDHGPGIPAADRDRMFTPFQRPNDHTAEGGLGLGLAIAQGFTLAMGGTITPSDTPGGGLTMTVTLPAAP